MAITVSVLGGGDQIGFSAYLLQHKKSFLLLDLGAANHFTFRNTDVLALLLEKTKGLANLAAVFVSHAHLDHVGLLPSLFSYGFQGPIFGSKETRELTQLSLKNRFFRSNPQKRGTKLENMVSEGIKLLDHLWVELEPNNPFEFQNWFVTPFYSGHLAGAFGYLFQTPSTNLLFTGDCSVKPSFSHAGLSFPNIPSKCYWFWDGTYLEKIPHTNLGSEIQEKSVGQEISRVASREGIAAFPCLELGKGEETFFQLWGMKETGKIPDIPIFLHPDMKRTMELFSPLIFRKWGMDDGIFREYCEVPKRSVFVGKIPPQHFPAVKGAAKSGFNSEEVPLFLSFHFPTHLFPEQISIFQRVYDPLYSWFIHTRAKEIPQNCSEKSEILPNFSQLRLEGLKWNYIMKGP